MAKHTRQSVADLIQERWESDLPDRVIEALRPFNGKAITTRLLDKLPGGRDEWRLHRNYGWTELSNMPYIRSQGSARDGVRLILARTEASVPLDLPAVEVDNVAYFAARRERNHARMEARNNAELLDDMAAVLNRIECAKDELEMARDRFEYLAGYGKPFHADYYELRKVFEKE